VPLSRSLGTLTSWNPVGHSGPVTGLLYLDIFFPIPVLYVQGDEASRYTTHQYETGISTEPL